MLYYASYKFCGAGGMYDIKAIFSLLVLYVFSQFESYAATFIFFSYWGFFQLLH